jgi:hypothetical protein
MAMLLDFCFGGFAPADGRACPLWGGGLWLANGLIAAFCKAAAMRGRADISLG